MKYHSLEDYKNIFGYIGFEVDYRTNALDEEYIEGKYNLAHKVIEFILFMNNLGVIKYDGQTQIVTNKPEYFVCELILLILELSRDE